MLTTFGEVQQPLRHVGSASRSLSGNQAEKVVFNGSPSEYFGPQSAKPGLFSVREPASAFEGSTGVVAGTGSLIKRRWSGGGGGRQLGPGIVGSRSSPGAVFLEQVSAPVCLGESESSGVVSESLIHAGFENTLEGVDLAGAGAENDFHDAQVVVPGFSGASARDAQLLPVAGLLGKGTSRGQREVAELLTTGPSSSSASSVVARCSAVNLHGAQLGSGPSCSLQDDFATMQSSVGRRHRRARGARVRPPAAGGICTVSQCNEAGSLLDLASIRVESPSSRVSRVTSALHNLCSVHSSSFPAHNSHARMSDARCVVNSVGDTEDGGRSSCVSGGTKSLSTCTRTGVRRPAVEKLASPQQASSKLHVETWAGLLKNQGPKIFRDEEIIPGCAVRVACPSCPDYHPEPPGPGIVIRNMLGWSKLEKTERSGVWVFRGALQGENLFSLLDAAGDWVKKGSYHTAWAVPGDSSCSCSYAYGHGPAVGPHTGRRCWPLLAGVWRAIAPLMKPWCAEGDVPTAANLNLYRGWNSCVGWHCDDEPLFGKCGDAKLIVSVSLGDFALFRWRRQSCSSNGDSSCRLDHGDILVMDGQCQDEFLHRTSPGREQDRINITFRWVKQHVASCPLFRAGVACCLPTCAQGSSVPVMGNVFPGVFWVFWFLLGILCIWGVLVFLVSLLCTRLGLLRCASCRTCPFGIVRLGLYLCNPWGEHLKIHKIASMYFGIFWGFLFGSHMC